MATFVVNQQLDGTFSVSNTTVGGSIANNTASCLQPCWDAVTTNGTVVGTTWCATSCLTNFYLTNAFVPSPSSVVGACLAECAQFFMLNFTAACMVNPPVNCSYTVIPNATKCFTACVANFSNLNVSNATKAINDTVNATSYAFALCYVNLTSSSGSLVTLAMFACTAKAVS